MLLGRATSRIKRQNDETAVKAALQDMLDAADKFQSAVTVNPAFHEVHTMF
jgi:hypothetical protein